MGPMSWSRSSKITAVVVTLALLAAAVAPAAAVTVDAEAVPQEAQVGDTVSATFTFNELYQNPQLEAWNLEGTTELVGVTWTVTFYDQTGTQVMQTSYDGQNLSQPDVSAADGVSEVEVQLRGEVPEISNFSYSEEETFMFAAFTQVRDGGASNELTVYETQAFTEDSKAARDAIEAAEAAIETASAEGADTAEPEQLRQSAISAYDNENFENAVTLATQSETKANELAQSQAQSQQRSQLLLYGAGAVVLLLVIGGVVYWWRSNQDTYDKLG